MKTTQKMVCAPIAALTLIGSLIGGANAATTIVSPGSILNSPNGTTFLPVNAVNQSGLSSNFSSGVTDFNNYIASNPIHSNISNSNEWFTDGGVPTAFLDLDLGSQINLGTFVLWNEEFTGVGTVEIFSSIDATFTSLTSLGSFSPVDNPPGPYPAEVFDITDASTRYVRLSFSDSGIGNNRVAVGEVAFGTAVPEPSSLVVFGLGCMSLAFRRSRH
jgi:hypothetical protein